MANLYIKTIIGGSIQVIVGVKGDVAAAVHQAIEAQTPAQLSQSLDITITAMPVYTAPVTPPATSDSNSGVVIGATIGGVLAALLLLLGLWKCSGTSTERRVSLVHMDSAADGRPTNALEWKGENSSYAPSSPYFTTPMTAPPSSKMKMGSGKMVVHGGEHYTAQV